MSKFGNFFSESGARAFTTAEKECEQRIHSLAQADAKWHPLQYGVRYYFTKFIKITAISCRSSKSELNCDM